VSINDPLESSIERRYVTYVEKKGCSCIKIEKRHWPDRLTIMDNCNMFFIEFKKKGEAPRKGQTIIHQRLRAKGFRVYVCDSYKQAIKIYENEKAI
jgi:hypothetical protein